MQCIVLYRIDRSIDRFRRFNDAIIFKSPRMVVCFLLLLLLFPLSLVVVLCPRIGKKEFIDCDVFLFRSIIDNNIVLAKLWVESPGSKIKLSPRSYVNAIRLFFYFGQSEAQGGMEALFPLKYLLGEPLYLYVPRHCKMYVLYVRCTFSSDVSFRVKIFMQCNQRRKTRTNHGHKTSTRERVVVEKGKRTDDNTPSCYRQRIKLAHLRQRLLYCYSTLFQ